MQRRDRAYVNDAVSDRMTWVRPLSDKSGGKQEWIDASFAVTWNWFKIDVRRVVEIGDDARIVESWIGHFSGRRTAVRRSCGAVDFQPEQRAGLTGGEAP